jgi:hypothetical protein
VGVFWEPVGQAEEHNVQIETEQGVEAYSGTADRKQPSNCGLRSVVAASAFTVPRATHSHLPIPQRPGAAIDLLWTEELRSLPHATPDGKSLVVPAEAVGYFARAGLRFTARKVLSINDLSAEEIRRLRR